MTEDLDTLLRDAGREPTIDLDVDAIAAAGRRRAAGRRVAGAVGAAAALALAIAVVPSLLPTAPDIDIAPQPDGGTVTEPEDASPSLAGLDPALVALLQLDELGTVGGSVPLHLVPTAIAEALDVDLIGLGWEEVAEAFDAQRIRSDGSDTVERLATGRVLADPVVAADGAVWWADLDGTVRRGDSTTGAITDVLASDGTSAWMPVGTVGDTDEVLVSRVGGLDGTPGPQSSGDLAILAADGRLTALPFPRLTTLAEETGAIYTDAHLAGEHLVARTLEDDGTERVVHGALGGELVDLAVREGRTADGPASYAAGIGIVGDELWVLDQLEDDVTVEGGPTFVVRRHDLDGAELAVLELPSDLVAGQELTGLRVAPTAAVVLVETVAFDGVTGTTLALFPAAIDAVDQPGDTVRMVDGEIVWAPARGTTAPSPLAACATGRPVNTEPVVGGLLFLCGDAGASLGPDEIWAFVTEPGPTGVAAPMDADDVRAVLELWAAGPTAEQAADGLSGGLDPEVATFETVSVDARTVTVDLVPGPQVGVLGTTGGRSQVVQAIVGMVLADESFDAVVITLDGDCEAWSVLGESEGCASYGRDTAPWATGVSACATDPRLNARPEPGVPVRWRWCSDAAVTVVAGQGFVPVVWEGPIASPPTADDLTSLVVGTFAPVTEDELALGLDAPGLVIDLDAEPALVDPPGLRVLVEGTRVVVDVDAALADLMQLGAPFQASLIETAVAGVVFQFDAFDSLELRVGGSCEAYEERLEGEPTGDCRALDEGAAPWGGG